MPRTSNKAQLIVDYVNQFIQENGYSPSVREIGAAVGLRSTASVSYHLQALQEKGLLASPYHVPVICSFLATPYRRDIAADSLRDR